VKKEGHSLSKSKAISGDAQTLAPTPADGTQEPRRLSPEAERALAEAAERRRMRDAARSPSDAGQEVGGRAGPDPVRYGDWENGGIASDF
jgi:hypothetical protein